MILVVFVNLFIWGTFSVGSVFGTSTPAACLFAAGAASLRRAGAASRASALFARPTRVGWLCKEIIKIFRLRGSVGRAAYSLMPTRRTIRVNRKISCKAQKCLANFFYKYSSTGRHKDCERTSCRTIFGFLCNIDFYRFDEKQYWWYIKRNGNARTLGYLHFLRIAAVSESNMGGYIFTLFYLLDKRALL